MSLLVTTLSVSRARLVAGLLAVLAVGAGAVFGAVVFLGLGRGAAVQLLTRIGVKLVPVEAVEDYGAAAYPPLEPAGPGQDGAARRQDHLQPGAGGRELLFVPDGGVTYEFAYKPDASK